MGTNLLIITQKNLGSDLTRALKEIHINALKVGSNIKHINGAYKQIGNVDGILLILTDIDASLYRDICLAFGYEWNRNVPIIVLGSKNECKNFNEIFNNVLWDVSDIPQYIYSNSEITPDIHFYYLPVNASSIADKILVAIETTKPKRKILVIDDDTFILKKIKLELKDEYEVLTSDNGNEGIKMAKICNPDAILLDYQMPDMDGQIVCALIQNDDEISKIPVFFLTSVAEEEIVKSLIRMKPKGYILKNSGYNRIRNTLYQYFEIEKSTCQC